MGIKVHREAKKLWLEVRNPKCKDCELHKSAQVVCLMGSGPVESTNIMVIGEAPGFREDEIGKPFAGRSGQLLRTTLRNVGINPEQIFITNVNKCRPAENRTPKASEAKACRPYLDGELRAVKPDYILTLGNHGLKLLKKGGILKHRGETYDFSFGLDDGEIHRCKVMPTLHPAAVLRNPRWAKLFDTDIAAFARLVKNESSRIKTRVILVQDKRALSVMLKAIMKSEVCAYDLETNGFEEFREDSAIATISVSTSPGVSFVVPIDHPKSRWKHPRDVLRILGNALVYSDCKLIAHNAKFDDRWLNTFRVPIHSTFDTMIAAHILDENRLKGLKPLAQMILGVDAWAIDTGDCMATPIEKLARYNAKDTDYTLRLYYKFREQLIQPNNRRSLRVFNKLMMPISETLTDVERSGIYVHQDKLTTRTVTVSKKRDKVLKRLNKLAGREINWNSHQQIASVLFEDLKLPIIETTKGGAPSSKESVLLRLRDKHEIPALILEYREHAKNLSTYFLGWASKLDEHGRIHPNYKIVGTTTGRLSSGKEEGDKGKGLNIQQVPRDPFIRGCLGAPPGWSLIEADFSQAELRIAAYLANEPTMLRYFATGYDIHLATAASVSGKRPQDITPEERKKAKAVNFGFLYGMGAKKFVDYARDNYGVIVSLDEAKEVRKRFFQEYAGLPAWHERQRRLANNYKQVQSLIGRVRHLPDIDSEEKDVRAEAERQAINSPVQSLASDMNLLAMILLHRKMNPTEARIIASIHDAILFEIRNDKVKYWLPRIKHTMENLPLKKKFGADLGVPVVVDLKVGQYWSEDAVEWEAA